MVDNEITGYIHCAKCLDDCPDEYSPRLWMDLEVGWTVNGFQVWCKRHDCNVLHVDFEGVVHPAEITT